MPSGGTDIEDDVENLLKTIAFLKEGRLSEKADGGKLGAVGGSYTSLHLYRLPQRTKDVKALLALGSGSDLFMFRRDFARGVVMVEPPLDTALIALGYPNQEPELYFKCSVVYHLEDLPPLCLIHSERDATVPVDQALPWTLFWLERKRPTRRTSTPNLSTTSS